MSLDLLDVKSISLAVRLGSLSRAAEALNLTQPALSRRIAEAEKSLGVILFERESRGVKPTDACLAFLRHGELSLANIDDAREAALDTHHRRMQKVSIALHESLCDDRLLAACKSGLPAGGSAGVTFSVFSSSADVSANLLSGEAKLGLRYRRDNRPQLQSTLIAEDRWIVACAPSHPFAANGAASMEQLEQAQWVGYPVPIDLTTTSIEEALRAGGFRGWKTTHVVTAHGLLKLLEADFGVGLVRRDSVVSQLQHGRLVELDTPLSVSIPIFLQWRRGSYLGEAAEALRDALRRAHVGRPTALP